MVTAESEQYFTYEARLASFQKVTKKRGSTTAGRGGAKPLNWPHKQIALDHVRTSILHHTMASWLLDFRGLLTRVCVAC